MANLNDFQLIEKYLPQSVDKFFAHDSKSAILEKAQNGSMSISKKQAMLKSLICY